MPILKECKECGQVMPVHKNRSNGNYYCRRCADKLRYHDPLNWGSCSMCPKFGPVVTYKRQKYCQGCYRKYMAKPKKCRTPNCTNKAYARYGPLGKVLCSTCASRHRMKDESKFEKCVGCGNNRPVAIRTIELLAICHNCYNKGVRDIA